MSSAKEVKSYLKEQGIETSNIRVNTKHSIQVKLLDPKLDYKQIDRLLREKFESVNRCEASGEILQGGNTFVFVEYDYDLVKQISQELMGTIRPYLETVSGRWDIHSLVEHYTKNQSTDYDEQIVKRAVRETLYTFFRDNPNDIEGLVIQGWN